MRLLSMSSSQRCTALFIIASLVILISPASNAGSAYNAVKAVFQEGHSVKGWINLAQCELQASSLAPPQSLTTTGLNNSSGKAMHVAISLSNSHLIRIHEEGKPKHSHYILRSFDLFPDAATGYDPGWYVREITLTPKGLIHVEIKKNEQDSWHWNCADESIAITNTFPLSPITPR